MVATEGARQDFAGTAGVFRFDVELGLTGEQTKAVSDHFPVYGVFAVGRDTGGGGRRL